MQWRGQNDRQFHYISGNATLQGIGLAIAKRFAEEGAKVAITVGKQATIDKGLKEIGPGSLGIQGDVSTLDDLTHVYQTVEKNFVKVDTLIVSRKIEAFRLNCWTARSVYCSSRGGAVNLPVRA